MHNDIKNNQKFPIYKVGHIFNNFKGTLANNVELLYKKIQIEYPCRLDAMAINPAAVCNNNGMIFTPGEVVICVNKYIKVKMEVKNDVTHNVVITDNTRRKALVKHAYYLMKAAIGFKETLEIDVDDTEVPKHCGMGSSSATIAAVAAAINEMYNNPIRRDDLIKYLASNHGEEIGDNNNNQLKAVQCIGGGATGGLTDAGVIVIAGQATTICKMKYNSKVLIGIPSDFELKDAGYLMKKEEENLWKFKKTGELYSKDIAYDILHKALPGLVNGSITELADVVFNYRFNMGSIENCSFVYENMVKQAEQLRKLYENGHCEFLALSSVGPAYFTLVKDEAQEKYCKEIMTLQGMSVIDTSICNEKYKIIEKQYNIENTFWNKRSIQKDFQTRPTSKYITDVIDVFDNKLECLDIGCGGGRYSRYINHKGHNVTAIDKYDYLEPTLKKIGVNFLQATFDNIPLKNAKYDLILSIGVIHNATTLYEYNKAFVEMNRLLSKGGKIIFSVFTNDIITSDLKHVGNKVYEVKEREPMVLLSKDEIHNLIKENGFNIDKVIDEHITYVGNGGARYVYSLLLGKEI